MHLSGSTSFPTLEAILLFIYIAAPVTIVFLFMRIFAKMIAKHVVKEMKAESQKDK